MPASRRSPSRMDALRALVDYHDRFWSRLSAAESPVAIMVASWVSTAWQPWVDHWREEEAFGDQGPGESAAFDPDVVRRSAAALSGMRQAARDLGVPVPDLSNFSGHHANVHTTGADMSTDIIGRRFGGGRFGYGARVQRWPRRPRPAPAYGYGPDPGYPEPYPYPDPYPVPVPFPPAAAPPAVAPVVTPAPDGDGDDVHVAPGLPPARMRKRRPPAATVSGAEAALVATESRPSDPSRELADLGSLIDPSSGAVEATLELDGSGVLHALVVVDGRAYEGTIDLADVFLHLAAQVAADRASVSTPAATQSAPAAQDPARDQAAVQAVAQETEAAAQAAGELLIGALVDQHCETVSAGWWHSVTSAASTAAKWAVAPAVYGNKALAKVLKDYKGPATAVAVAAATAYGGPAAGAAAAQLTGPLIDAVAGDSKASREVGAAVVSAAREAAKTNPTVAKALGDAHRAVANTAATYHLASTASKALSGDRDAAKKMVDLSRAATRGDPAAASALQTILDVMQISDDNAAAAAGTADPMPPEVSSGEVVGSAIASLRQEAMGAARSALDDYGARVVGYVKSAAGPTTRRGRGGSAVVVEAPGMTQVFSSADEADDWFGALDPRSYLYAAYFSADDPTWPFPLHESLGGPAAQAARRAIDHTVSGALGVLPMAAGFAAGAAAAKAYGWWRRRRLSRQDRVISDAADRAQRLADQDRILSEAADTAIRAAQGDPAAVAQVADAAAVASGWYPGYPG